MVEQLDMVREWKSYAAVWRHYGVNESTVRYYGVNESTVRYYGVNESTVRYIEKNEKAVRSSVASSFCVKMVNVVQNKAIVRMEFALVFWILDLPKKNIPLDTKMIRRKALILYSKFNWGNEGEPQPGPSSASDAEEFQTNKSWLDRFVKRYQLRI